MEWLESRNYVGETRDFDAPSLFAKVLCETIPIDHNKTRLLDIGCGLGIIGLYCLIERKAAFVTFCDIQLKAIVATRENASRHIEQGTIHESQCNYWEGSFDMLPASIVQQHDLLACNPPQLPTDFVTKKALDEIVANPAMSLYRLGGADGLQFARQFFRWYSTLNELRPRAVINLSSFLGRRQINAALQEHGLVANILAETEVPLRPFLVSKAEHLSDEEKGNRSIRLVDDKWTKRLLTISVQHRR